MKFSPIMLAGVIYATTALAADARCYRYWYYPTPQKCGGIYLRTHHHDPVAVRAGAGASVPASHPDIPLPDMSATWGGAMDTELELSLQRQKAIRQLTLRGN